MADRPIIGVGGVIVRQGRVLLVRRADEPGRGLWSVPGGKLKWGESLAEAVRREAREETGLTVEVERLAGVTEMRLPEGQNPPEFHYVLLDFICRAVSGDAACASDADDIGWFRLDELDRLRTTDGLAEKLREWMGFDAA